MTAKEFRKKQDYPYNHFSKLTSTGISTNYKNIEEFAETYYKYKLNEQPVNKKRLQKIRFRYNNSNDNQIYSDTFEAETAEDTLQMLYNKYGYDNVEWYTIHDVKQ